MRPPPPRAPGLARPSPGLGRAGRLLGLLAGLTALGQASSAAAGAGDVLTSRYDDARTGAGLHETLLRPDNVGPASFGLLFSYDLGAGAAPGEAVEVYAQPLYVGNVGVPGRGLVNLVLVATTANVVTAFDADGPMAGSDGVLWRRSLGAPPSMDDVKANCGPQAPCLDAGSNTHGDVGILSTPVIDRTRGLAYVVARVRLAPGRVSYHLHALDLRTGADRTGSPVTIAASALGVTFDANVQNQRTGLALAGGQVIVSWGSYADLLPYHGWVMAYRYDDGGSFTQTGVFVTTPDGSTSATCAVPTGPAAAAIDLANATAASEALLAAASTLAGDLAGAAAHTSLAVQAKAAAEAAALAAIPQAANSCAHGGIWMAGRAPVVDANGDVLLMIGNGRNDLSATSSRNFGNSLVRLDPRQGLAVTDFFTPENHLLINAADLDLGGSGPMIIPQSRLVVGGGKEGVMHVWRLDALGRLAPGDASVVQKFPAGPIDLHLDTGNDMPGGAIVGGVIVSAHAGHIMGGPVYWPRPSAAGGSRLYNWSENAALLAYAVDPTARQPIAWPAVATGPDFQAGHPGGILTLSANGADPASGIVWATTYDARGTSVPGLGVTGALNQVRPGTLRAYAASESASGSLASLWTSDQRPGDGLGLYSKFTPPTVAAGRVYVTTFSNRLMVYGLRQHAYVRPAARLAGALAAALPDDED